MKDLKPDSLDMTERIKYLGVKINADIKIGLRNFQKGCANFTQRFIINHTKNVDEMCALPM